ILSCQTRLEPEPLNCRRGQRRVAPVCSQARPGVRRNGRNGCSACRESTIESVSRGFTGGHIEIEDDYVEAIKDRYGVHTKTEAVDLALRHLAGQPMTREQALAMRGARAMGDVPADAGPRGAA
ncbi:MAG: type II toxin-antitoxin system VapB family antitoxin, partial [Actinomycetota bacterium]|nr:type II toxin-antitoxin system VapB family antitoxin [Actinomycetota bacterium]